MNKKLISVNILIICIFLITIAFAEATIMINSIEGSSGVNGIISNEDTVTAHILASTNIESLTMNDEACTKEGLNFMCTKQFTQGDSPSFLFQAFDSNSNLIEESTETMLVDSESPIIDSIEISTTPLGIKYRFSVNDPIILGAICGGIGKIEFLAVGSVVNTVDYNGECSFSGEENILYDHTDSFSIKVYDRLGNSIESTPETVNITKALVSEFGIEYDGEPITKISLENPITATVVFKIDADSIEGVTVNLSNIVTNPVYKNMYSSIYLTPNSCHRTNASELFKCGIDSIIINPGQEIINVTFEVLANGNIQSMTQIVHTFTIDNSAPELKTITANFCYEEKCYMKPNTNNKINFEFDDATEPFSRKNVFYTFDNTKYQIHNCSNGICLGYTPQKNCNSGQMYRVDLVTAGLTKSTDDAGNPIVSNLDELIYCDSLIPYDNHLGDPNNVSSIEIVPNSDYGIIVGGTGLEINAYVFEDGPVLNAVANLSNIGGDAEPISCVKNNIIPYLFECSWNIPRLYNNYTQTDLTFEFFDFVNNSHSETVLDITIIKDAENNLTTPDCLRVEDPIFMPKQINRIALDLAMSDSLTYPLYGSFDVNRKSGSSCADIQVYEHVMNPECIIEFSNGTIMAALNVFNDIKVAYPNANVDAKNHIELNPKSDMNLYDSNYNLICNLSFIVADSENLYEDPLIIPTEWEIIFINSAFGRPGERYTDVLIEYEDRITNEYNTILAWANAILATSTELCSAKNYLNLIGTAGTGVSMVESVIGKLGIDGLSIGNGMVRFTNSFGKEGDIKSDGVMGLASNILEQACALSSCSLGKFYDEELGSDPQTFTDWAGYNRDWGFNGFIQDGEENAENYDSEGGAMELGDIGSEFSSDLFSGINTPNTQNSLFACITTGCIQGIVYHLNRIREADCDEMYCIKRNAQYGLGISACYEAKSTFYCKWVVGEIFELPYIREIKNLADNLNNIVQNFAPKMIVNFWSSAACGEHYKNVVHNQELASKRSELNTARIVMCEIPLSLGRLIRTQNLGSQAGHFSYPNGPDVCALALCNEENESECQQNAGFIGRMLPDIGIDLLDISSMSGSEKRENMQTTNRGRDTFFDNMRGAVNAQSEEALKSYLVDLVYDDGLDIDLSEENIQDLFDHRGDNAVHDAIAEGINELDSTSQNQETLTIYGATDGVGGDPIYPDYESAQQDSLQLEYLDLLTGESSSGDFGDLEPIYDQLGDGPQAQTIGREIGNGLDDENKNQETLEDLASQIDDQEWVNDISNNLGNFPLGDCYGQNEINGIDCNKVRDQANELIDSVPDNRFDKARQNQQDWQDQKDFHANREKTQDLVDIGTRLLWNTFLKDVGTLENIADKWDIEILGDFSNTMNTVFNSESWANSLCNPQNDFDGTDSEGSVIDCTGSHCQTILTMAMEKGPYNWTNEEEIGRTTANIDHKIYTFVYLLGPVKEEFDFNIYFIYGNSQKHYVYQDDEGDRITTKITAEEGKNTISESVSFTSDNEYKEVCFEFDKPFPGVESGNNDQEFCRDIVDLPESDFATGQPDRSYGLPEDLVEDNEDVNTVFG